MAVYVEVEGRVAIVKISRPEALNALNTALMEELIGKLTKLDRDSNIGCFILTGAEKVFAAGADIKEMSEKSYSDMVYEDYFAAWSAFTDIRTPKIAAVRGLALGGGCELAMMCDIIFASDTAKFGQPEIRLGVIPGMGGSQRLTRLIGRSKAMDMVLTGRTMDANEAERAGLVARVVPDQELISEAIKAASTIADFGKIATMAAREAVNQAEELSLQDGLLFERRTFHALFDTPDQKEGMNAFIEKRKPKFHDS